MCKFLAAMTLAAGFVVGLVGLSAAAPEPGGTVVVAQQAQPPSLDAATTSSEATRNMSSHVFECLFTRDENARVIPQLAKDYSVAKDGLSMTVTLRKGVKFHNGKEMTSQDVIASLERYRKVGASAKIMVPVTAIEALDPYTVKLSFSHPMPIFIEQLSSPRGPVVIIPAEEAAKPANKAAVIGTGPYKFVEYVPDDHLTLERFDGYVPDDRFDGPSGFGGKRTAYIDKIEFRFVPEAGARAAGLETGEFQAVDNLAAPSARRLKDNPDITVFEAMPWSMQTFFFNTAMAPTDNQKFRQAVLAALDMEEIMAIASDGLYRMGGGWQYPEGEYYPGDIDKDLYNQHNNNKAKKLLAEAGYSGQEMIFLTDTAFKNDNDAAVVAAEQLRKVGINVTIKTLDWPSTVKTRAQPTGWNMVPIGVGTEPWEGPYGVAVLLAESVIHKAKDPEMGALYDKLISEGDKEARKATFAQIQQANHDKVYAIKLGDLGQYVAVRSNLKGYKPYRMGRFWDVWYEN